MSALFAAALAGLIAGLVHVLSGPDHLAAVLPFAVDKPRRALKVGLFWGVGHGAGVVVLGALFLGARAYFDVDSVSRSAELLVGFLLVALGLWAIKRSRRIVFHTHAHDHQVEAHAHPHVHIDDPTVDDDAHAKIGAHEQHQHSTLGFGFVHGVAGVGHLVGAGPILAMSASAAGVYLVTYLLGGIFAMMGFSALAGSLVRKPAWVPRGLLTAGVMSVGVGMFWVVSFALA